MSEFNVLKHEIDYIPHTFRLGIVRDARRRRTPSSQDACNPYNPSSTVDVTGVARYGDKVCLRLSDTGRHPE